MVNLPSVTAVTSACVLDPIWRRKFFQNNYVERSYACSLSF